MSTSAASSMTRILRLADVIRAPRTVFARIRNTNETGRRCGARAQGYNGGSGPLPVSHVAGDAPEKEFSINEHRTTDIAAVTLVEAAGLRDACDLDLLLFFSRHPRVVLGGEQLATYVGYEVQQVARALDLFLGRGLLKRTLHPSAPGRMYVLEVDHAEEWLEPLRKLCAMPDGRNALKALLKQRQAENAVPSHRRIAGRRRIDHA